MRNRNAPTLTDARGMGGVIAQDGFDAQLWYALTRVPAWLANPAFEEFVLEGLEDIEARFFAPHVDTQRLLERYQVKTGELKPTDVRSVFEDFLKFERAFPRIARVQTLVSASLPASLKWLARDTARVRQARPFYAPFAAVVQASDDKVLKDLQESFGKDLGRFVSESVEVIEVMFAHRDIARAAFGDAFHRAFPALDVTAKAIGAMFDALSTIGQEKRGAPLRRENLIAHIEQVLGQPLFASQTFPLYVRSDSSGNDERALEIGASAFSGSNGVFPDVARWREELLTPLERTARWLRERGTTRIALSGSYRLTTAFALGYSLRSAAGFEIDIVTRAGPWATDDRPRAAEAYAAWRITDATALDGECLHVCIGVLRDPSPTVWAQSVGQGAVLSIVLDQPIASAHSAQNSVSEIKRAVAAAVARLRPERIALYYAGPAALAVALGHRWNSLPPTQLHEFRAEQSDYVRTAVLETHS